MYYHVVRVRECGLKANNPIIAYYGVTTDQRYAENLADTREVIGGTYLDVHETDSQDFDMSWLAEG